MGKMAIFEPVDAVAGRFSVEVLLNLIESSDLIFVLPLWCFYMNGRRFLVCFSRPSPSIELLVIWLDLLLLAKQPCKEENSSIFIVFGWWGYCRGIFL